MPMVICPFKDMPALPEECSLKMSVAFSSFYSIYLLLIIKHHPLFVSFFTKNLFLGITKFEYFITVIVGQVPDP